MLIQFLFHMIINYMNFQNMTYFFWYHLNGCVIHLINKTSTKDWRRKWQPTPVFLPGESHGRRSLVGCSPWGRTESDTTSDAATANVPRKKHTFPISIFSILSIDQWHYWWKKKKPCQCRRCKRHRFDPWVRKIPGGGHTNPSSVLARRIPWTEDPVGLQSMGSHRVGQSWSDFACTHT